MPLDRTAADVGDAPGDPSSVTQAVAGGGSGHRSPPGADRGAGGVGSGKRQSRGLAPADCESSRGDSTAGMRSGRGLGASAGAAESSLPADRDPRRSAAACRGARADRGPLVSIVRSAATGSVDRRRSLTRGSELWSDAPKEMRCGGDAGRSARGVLFAGDIRRLRFVAGSESCSIFLPLHVEVALLIHAAPIGAAVVLASQRCLLQWLFAAVVGFAARQRGASAAGGHQTALSI